MVAINEWKKKCVGLQRTCVSKLTLSVPLKSEKTRALIITSLTLKVTAWGYPIHRFLSGESIKTLLQHV